MQRIRLGGLWGKLCVTLRADTVEDGHLELVPDLLNLPHFCMTLY